MNVSCDDLLGGRIGLRRPARARTVRRATSTIRPSSMWAMLSAKWKTRLSWVTTMTAAVRVDGASGSSSMTVSPVSWSSAAVGSSQTTRRGSWTSARAMATRCCCPPESCEGSAPVRLPRPSRDSRDFARATAAFRGARRQERHGDVLGGGQRRQQVVLLEDEADVAAAEQDARGRPSARRSASQDRHSPAVRRGSPR